MSDENTSPKKQQSPMQKFIIELGPLIVFFAAFKFGDLMVATACFMVAMVIGMIASYKTAGHVSAMLKFTFVVVMIMGGLTLYLQDETFVKMKLTIINVVLGSILLVGWLRGRSYLKVVMEMAFDISDKGWMVFTRNYAVFLLVMAGMNELVWRTQTTEFWVNFKTFGYLTINMVVIIWQISWLVKNDHMELPEEKKE